MKWCFTLLSLCLLSCHYKQDVIRLFKNQPVIKIYVQPFNDDLSPFEVSNLAHKMKKYHANIVLLKPIDLPYQAWYKPRKRYRADSLINQLRNKVKDGEVIIGLTSKDISTTKNGIKDFGVMGLGYTPGKSCIVSTYRLNKKNLEQQFFKVTIHELGHTQGLKHCPVKTCFMRDAEGGNPTNEEKEFCERCRKFLIKRRWTL